MYNKPTKGYLGCLDNIKVGAMIDIVHRDIELTVECFAIFETNRTNITHRANDKFNITPECGRFIFVGSKNVSNSNLLLSPLSSYADYNLPNFIQSFGPNYKGLYVRYLDYLDRVVAIRNPK